MLCIHFSTLHYITKLIFHSQHPVVISMHTLNTVIIKIVVVAFRYTLQKTRIYILLNIQYEEIVGIKALSDWIVQKHLAPNGFDSTVHLSRMRPTRYNMKRNVFHVFSFQIAYCESNTILYCDFSSINWYDFSLSNYRLCSIYHHL